MNTKPSVSSQLGIEDALRAFRPGLVVFERFELETYLGRGAADVVWLSRDIASSERVALKLLPKVALCDHAGLNHLRSAVQDARRLNAPNIAKVHELVEDAHWVAIASEAVDGETIDQIRADLDGGVLEPDALQAVLGQVLAALEYAHGEAHVLHRKLTPANILVDRNGQVKVSDFGVARVISDCLQRATGHVGMAGELLYLSPQQLDGEPPCEGDDIYALGACLYELLTGKPPFHSGDVIWQIRNEELPSLTDRRKELGVTTGPISKAWEKLVASCLAKETQDRPQNVTAIAAAKQLATRGAVPGFVPLPSQPAAVVVPEALPLPVFSPKTPPPASEPVAEAPEPEPTPASAPEPEATLAPPTTAAEAPSAGSGGFRKDFVPFDAEEDDQDREYAEAYESTLRRSKTLPAIAAVVVLGLLAGAGYYYQDNIRQGIESVLGLSAAPVTQAVSDEEETLTAHEALAALQETAPATAPEQEAPATQEIPPADSTPVAAATPEPEKVAEPAASPAVPAQSAYERALAEADAAAKEAEEQALRAADLRAAAEEKAKRAAEVRAAEDARLAKRREAAQSAAEDAREKAEILAKLNETLAQVEAAAETANEAHREQMLAAQKAQAEATAKSREIEELAQQIQDAETALVTLNENRETLVASIGEIKALAETRTAEAETARAAAEQAELARAEERAELQRAKQAEELARAAAEETAAELEEAKQSFAADFPGGSPDPPRTDTDALAEQARNAADSENWRLDAEAPQPQPVVGTPRGTPQAGTPAKPAEGTHENSLGMRFVPVGPVHFSVFETRVQDFEAFVEATDYSSDSRWRTPGFQQGPDHPVCNVTWNDAMAFCKWLTEHDREKGVIGADQAYRLPTDQEWSLAVGLPAEEGATPEIRDMGIPNVYPWGTEWPPPADTGNYTGAEAGSDSAIPGHDDGFVWTGPVGSFRPNSFGLYDMGGNVWEWCMDWWNKDQKARVLRGASWYNGGLKLSLLSSCRICSDPGTTTDNYGFRVVLASALPPES